MQTVLLINASEARGMAKSEFNKGLFEAAKEELLKKFEVIETNVSDGFVVADEIEKFKKADAVIWFANVFWYSIPAMAKSYMEEVFSYGSFFTMDAEYGSGGLMKGKKLMLCSTWGATKDVFGNKDHAFMKGITVDDLFLPFLKSHEYCGFEQMDHYSSHNLMMGPNFDEDRDGMIKVLRANFKLDA
eukprot:TRINITY_DN141420_c0_g1_i1.p1 TRINITY_DN141420_c0_g1~~TRINITY_DN141420_c0_g1_i1.p1  ORF type:complete len:187 (-),score=59.68 TRINITY_DN141420_c0_g1_i1:115-675(-)